MPCAPYDQRNILFQLNGQTCITLKSNQYIQMQYFLTNPKYQPHCTNISIDVWIDPLPPPTRKRVCCPPGMLLRYFVNFYDMEIIEEEAFLAWKEDISQEFPGKGKALFQVPGRLTSPCRVSPLGATHLTSPHPLPPPSGQPVAHLAGDGGGGGVGRRRRLRRRRRPRWIDHIWISLSPPFFVFFFFLSLVFCFPSTPAPPRPRIIRKSALDVTTSGAARGCISLRK